MLLVQVEVHTLVIDLFLEDLVVLVLHELRERLLLLGLRHVLSCGHRELKVIVEIAESVDDRAQLFILLLEHLDLVGEPVDLVDELLCVLHLPLLLLQQELEHCFVVLARFLIVCGDRSGGLRLNMLGILDRSSLPLVGVVRWRVRRVGQLT